MTTNRVEEEQPMIVSVQPVTSGSENDSQVGTERVLVVTRWLGAQHGPLDRIVLPREPATEEEREWIRDELLTRLVSDGKLEVVENHSQERHCRDCGCTDSHACPGGCYWIDIDLCSQCYPASDTTEMVLSEVYDERERQDAKWGQQNHPNGTRASNVIAANQAKALTDAHAKAGTLTWRDILDEEVQEAFAETDPALLRAELVQVAAVATAWVEAIDRRTS